MFWVKPEAIRPLIELKLQHQDYPKEPVPDDGTILHAIERIIPTIVQHQGYKYATTYVAGVTR
jgi:lipopolysaccharide biosynthesis protein